VRASLEYAGDAMGSQEITIDGERWRLDSLYVYLMGVTGCAFRLNWGPGWGLDNTAVFHMSDDAGAPYRRAMESLGFPGPRVGVMKGQHSEAAFRRHIMEGLHQTGMPVMAHGVVGPPESSLIAGYDEGGDVLIGWSYYQGRPGQPVGWWGDLNRDGIVEWNPDPDVTHTPSGYYLKSNWYPGTWDASAFIPGRTQPPLDEVYHDALGWALRVANTPLTYNRLANGLAAYTRWAEAIQREEDFPTAVVRDGDGVRDGAGARDGVIDVLRDRYMVHAGATRVVAEGRWYAARFLEQAAQTLPAMADHLLAAAACYETEHDLMWEAWRLVGYEADSPLLWHQWIFNWEDRDQLDAYARTFAEPGLRRQIVPLIQQAQTKDAEAIEHIAQALKE
jgi:hypothetical protein